MAPTDAVERLRATSLPATSEAESKLLLELDTLADNVSVEIASQTVVAGHRFDSASGRVCRFLTSVTTSPEPAQRRLACSSGSQWFFVPNVQVELHAPLQAPEQPTAHSGLDAKSAPR